MTTAKILADLLREHEPLITMVEPYQAAALLLKCPKANNGYDLRPHWLTLDHLGAVHGYRGVVANNYDDTKRLNNITHASTALAQLLNQGSPDDTMVHHGYARIEKIELMQQLIPLLPSPRLMPIQRLLECGPVDRAKVLFFLHHGRAA